VKISFKSVFGPYIIDFIELKQSVGYKYESFVPYQQFDSFVAEREVMVAEITRGLCEEWCLKRPNEAESTRLARISAVRNIGRYVNSLGMPSYIPRIPRSCRSTFTPHIYTQDELGRFFVACDEQKVDRYTTIKPLYPAMFRFLYGTGARVGEAYVLRNRDVNLADGIITLHDTKNGQDRILPISDSLKLVLVAYSESGYHKNGADDFFFAKKGGKQITHGDIYPTFRTILWQAGIPYGGRENGPRIHDFRHSFAVHSLAKLAEDGVDLYYAMPFLAKYLGHTSLESTDGYVRLTEEMFPSVLEKANRICSCVFPDIKEVTVDEI
jgi:integrase